jgi:hypothetical protein
MEYVGGFAEPRDTFGLLKKLDPIGCLMAL